MGTFTVRRLRSITAACCVVVGLGWTHELRADKAPATNGISSDAHRQYMGQIVFADAEAAVEFQHEQPKRFRNSFKLSEKIFIRVYMRQTFQEFAEAAGKPCTVDDDLNVANAKLIVTLDGKKLARPLRGGKFHEAEYQTRTTFRPKTALNGPVAEGTDLQEDFGRILVPALTPGAHKVHLDVVLECWAKFDNGYDTGTVPGTVAAGDLELHVDARTLGSFASTNGAKMPEPQLKDHQAALQMTAAIQREWTNEKIMRTVITAPAWQPQHHPVSGVVVGREIPAAVAAKNKKGECRVFRVTFEQATAGGNKYGPMHLESIGASEPIPCENVH